MLPNIPPAEILHIHTDNPGTSFGQCAPSYALGRKAYPREIFALLSRCCPFEESILELGCGTGLATRQLYELGYRALVATDADPLMLEQAQAHCPHVSFQVANAHHLPFENTTYGGIVAFGCFHWFCADDAIEEIKRVLQSRGVLFIVNKYDTGPFRKKFRDFLETSEGKPFLEAKSNYQPTEMLTNHGFAIEEHIFSTKEIFTQSQLLAYAQSISLWTALPPDTQERLKPDLAQWIDNLMDHEHYERPIDIHCLIATPNTSLY